MDIVYVDTNVYRDWFEWRRGRGFMLHQGQEALDLFNDIKGGKFILLTSDHLETQLHHQLKDYGQYTAYIAELESKELHKHIIIEQADKDQAEKEIATHRMDWEDAMHGVLAVRGMARYFATQNEPHFRGFCDRLHVRRPRLIGLQF
jgi:hypothetical protein